MGLGDSYDRIEAALKAQEATVFYDVRETAGYRGSGYGNCFRIFCNVASVYASDRDSQIRRIAL